MRNCNAAYEIYKNVYYEKDSLDPLWSHWNKWYLIEILLVSNT